MLCFFLSIQSTATETNPVFQRATDADYKLQGYLNHYAVEVTKNWLLTAPEKNPGIFSQIANRNQKPYKDLLPWSGEFTGKYLTGAVQILRLTGDKELRDYLQKFTGKLIALQAENGYLGVFPTETELTGKYAFGEKPDITGTWDTWNHYHVMMGLLFWNETSGDKKALLAAQKIGDLLCEKFLGKPKALLALGSDEMNLAPVHSLSILYKKTGEKKYLDLAEQIVNDEFPGGGDYYRQALAGKEYYQMPKPRWESLHPIMGLAELYWITGNEKYRKAYEAIWWSIVKLDRHNTGGFSSGEQAVGNPYAEGAIETCCTIAWSALTVEMLKLTGDSRVADELELSLMNGVLGYQSPDGKWSTYDTPMNGIRGPNTTQIAFQKRPGSEDFNCCSANAPRGIGLISDWGLMKENDNLVLNWYGAGTMTASVKDTRITLIQNTEYPKKGNITLTITPEKEILFGIKLRIPYWSLNNRVTVNGTSVKDVQPGYLSITRKWKKGDTIKISLDMSLHYWAGEKEREGKVSAYYGPVLLAYSIANDAPDGPELDAKNLQIKLLDAPDKIVALEAIDTKGNKQTLSDFASLGWHNDKYISWLKIQNVPKLPYSKDNPLRSGRVK